MRQNCDSAVGVDNPAAKILVEMSRYQDDEVGDGTTSVTVLASELLREAEKLIEKKLHPQTIIAGWRAATQAAHSALIGVAQDNSKDAEKFREDLMNISKLAVDAEDSFLEEGFLLDKKHQERKDLDRQHADGHGQDQGVRIEHQDEVAKKKKMKDKVTTRTIIDEADRSLHDAFRVLAAETSGKESMAMEAFGRALL
ncbi:T-complex protein 1 subunit beta-like [Culex quinquefasciatus]|uniref:T-complex protein 1 subunit beta-like n=1 Tax=Culex quinquefasciatus TaxID=7176 RepID=UPI0018E2FC72|nr:T-complex protein 1 subunit beta-like [Culex quinquefasciatus]